MMSVPELSAELGRRVRHERLRQNLSQRTLAERAGVSRLTVTRMEADGSATLASFLSVLVALRRSADLELLLRPPPVETIEQFLDDPEPARQRGSR
jgi:transcriptional regulator with XRE-family HTH domain